MSSLRYESKGETIVEVWLDATPRSRLSAMRQLKRLACIGGIRMVLVWKDKRGRLYRVVGRRRDFVEVKW